jgi:P-type E1-E2 ATPase
MIKVSIAGRVELCLAHLALDLNGTVALDGQLITGVAERLQALGNCLQLHLLTADTLGNVAQIEAQLGFSATRIRSAADKTAFVERLGGEYVVALGNGANDAGMLSAAALGIAVLGPEGMAREAMVEADIVTPDILTALDLLLKPKRLVATLRR